MGQRMFVAVVPPPEVVEDLADFLAPREGMRWTHPEQWHLTLAFLADVPEHRIEELAEALRERLRGRTRFPLSLAGAGAFPGPTRARVLWLGVDPAAVEPLAALARNVRNVAAHHGAPPDGRAFVPHLTLARLRQPVEATRWLRVLQTYRSPEWTAAEVELVASHLGEGPGRRPRHETVAALPLSPG